MKPRPARVNQINRTLLTSLLLICFYLFNRVDAVYAQQPLAETNKVQPQYTGVYEKTLANGLKIIAKPDVRSQVVVFQIWYKVGSADESSGTTGVSHAMEHMMQKGMKEFYNMEYIDRLLPGIGDSNAFTTRDYTTYYHLLEKSRLNDIFYLEAWRMNDLPLIAASFAQENKVIQEERRQQTEDIPKALLYEQFNALAYNNSGYRQPIIGWMTDIQHMQLDDLQHWYRQYYAPDNATIVVVGDIDPNEVFSLAEHYFSPIQPASPITHQPRNQSRHTGSKRFVMSSNANLPFLIVGFKVPSLVTAENPWEAYALDLLASILDSGDNTRLNRHLIRHQKMAAEMSVEYELYAQQQTQFIIQGVPNKDFSVDDLELAILGEIERLKNEPVSEQELKRIKRQIIAAEVYDKDSMFYQAKKMGIAESAGIGWRKDEDYVDQILAINSVQLQQAAKKHFTPLNLTIAAMNPLFELPKESGENQGKDIQ